MKKKKSNKSKKFMECLYFHAKFEKMNMKLFMWMSSRFLLEIRIYREWGCIGKHSGV